MLPDPSGVVVARASVTLGMKFENVLAHCSAAWSQVFNIEEGCLNDFLKVASWVLSD